MSYFHIFVNDMKNLLLKCNNKITPVRVDCQCVVTLCDNVFFNKKWKSFLSIDFLLPYRILFPHNFFKYILA